MANSNDSIDFNDLFGDQTPALPIIPGESQDGDTSGQQTIELVPEKRVESMDAIVIALSGLLSNELTNQNSFKEKLDRCESILFAPDIIENMTQDRLLEIYNTITNAKFKSGQFVIRMLELLSKHSVIAKYFEKMAAASTHPNIESLPTDGVKELKTLIMQALNEIREVPNVDDN